MLRFHQGSWDDAASLFQSARELSSRAGDRIGEFRALEHLIVLELERDCPSAARELCGPLMELAGKLRAGSEAPFAQCLSALAAIECGVEAHTELDAALSSLRIADAKHRLAYALLRAAGGDLRSGKIDVARARGEEALGLARLLDRPSETAQAQVVLLRAATAAGDAAEAGKIAEVLQQCRLDQAAAYVRQAALDVLAAQKGGSLGNRGRRKTI